MNVYLTAFFNTKIDPQRGEQWIADDNKLNELKNSAKSKLIIFTDCLPITKTNKTTYIYRKCNRSPYFERWFAYYNYLSWNPNIEKVFCVDATDVRIVNEPFSYMENRLYVGDEEQFLGTDWMIDNHPEPFLRDFMIANRKKKLLNGGLVGGDRDSMLSFLSTFIEYSERYPDLGNTDMGLLNYILYTKFKGKVSHGYPINSKFKKYEERDDVWFLHK